MKAETFTTKFYLMAGLAALTVAVYFQVVGHEFIDLDDLPYITQNDQVNKGFTLTSLKWAFTSTRTGNWHPLTWISHMVDVSIFGLNAGGHHAVNLLLHTANTLLLFHLLTKTTGTVYRSAMTAALFAIHPLHVESVAWVAERKDVLSTLFFLLTLLAYRSYAHSPSPARYLFTLSLFTLGLMSKSMLVSLPIVLLLFDYWPLGRFPFQSSATDSPPQWRFYAEKIPFIAISALFCGISLYSQSQGEAISYDTALTIGVRGQNALIAAGTYLYDSIWPIQLAPFYPFTVPIPILPTLLSAVCLAAITLLAILQWRRQPYLITGWFWYLLTLLPVIGFVQIGLQARADRYTYIPMIGVFIAMIWATADIFENIKIRRQVVTMISGIILVLLSILSFRQVSYWKNTHTLFSHALAVTRNNYLAAMILGNDYYAKRDFQKAIACYQQAISFGSYKSVAHLLHSQLATAYGIIGMYDQAITHYLLAIQANPQIAQTFFLLAELQEIKGNSSDAMANLRKALTINPDLPTANFALAQLLQKYGDDLGALTYYRAVLRNQPENPDALNAIGKHEAKQGNVSTARDYFSKALLHRPTFIDARRNLESLSSNRPDW